MYIWYAAPNAPSHKYCGRVLVKQTAVLRYSHRLIYAQFRQFGVQKIWLFQIFQKSQLFSSHQTWSSHLFMKIYPNYLQSIHPAIKPLRSGSMHICPNKNHWKKAKTPALQQMFVLNKKNMGWVPSSLWYRWFHEGFNRTWRCLFVEAQFLLGQSQTARLFFSFNPDVPLVLPVFSWSISYLDSQFPSVLYPPLVTV